MSEAPSSPDRLEDTAEPATSPEMSEQGSRSRKDGPESAKGPDARADADSPGAALNTVESADDDDLLDESLPVPQGDEARAVLEALLFSATSPLSEKRLCNLMNGIDVASLREGIEHLRADYDADGRGITIMEVAGGYQLATRQEYAEWVFRLHKHRKRSALTPAVLETLAIVAYKQPIVRADIEAIRGVDCGGILRQLQDAGLVEVVGRKEVAGRPPLYGTSDLFLKSFGLKRLSDLPAIEELHTILAEAAGHETTEETETEWVAAEQTDKEERAAQAEFEFDSDSDSEDSDDEEEEFDEEDELEEDDEEDAENEDEFDGEEDEVEEDEFEDEDEDDEDEDEEWEEDDEDRSS